MRMKDRYSRQTILPEIGMEGQVKIARASVLCIGAGGLGCPALLYLAAAGVGRIGIVDFDRVDESNLQRQVLFTVEQIGQNKAQAAKARLCALNPGIEITAYPFELNDQNAPELFQAYDIILDGTDNFATKFLINDVAVKYERPMIYGSILGFDGQVSVFNAGAGAPCYRCLFPHPPKGHVPNCAEAGVIGAVAGMIGTAQAMEAIKIIVNHESFEVLSGRFCTWDLKTMESRILNLGKNPQCPVCSKNKDSIVLHYESPVCGVLPEISPQGAREKTGALFVDVREDHEWDAGHIAGAVHVPLSALLEGEFVDFSKDCDIVLYCQRGFRSRQAGQILIAKGYTRLYNMTGGYELWSCT